MNPSIPAVGEEEFTELVDADIPRVDLVDKAANGMRFLIAKRDGNTGLMDPEFVRDLIGKAAPAGPDADAVEKEQVTMTGSPGAIAKLIHEAAQRQADSNRPAAGEVAKAELSTASINDLPDSAFAYIESGGKKDESGKTTPRSLRHFPIQDPAHIRNALARAPQSPFGDKAMPKIRAAAKKFGIEVEKTVQQTMDVAKTMDLDDGVDGLDPTVPLAAPDMDADGDPLDPGSPAWEAIDAATACKWTSILARAKAAVGLLADREMLEAAAGDDSEQVWCLEDACCAIDYAISILAPFAAGEQAEADKGEAFSAFGKAIAGFDTSALDTVESLGAVRKAGRVLSAANEAAILAATESLQKVLASLPAAPTTDDGGQQVAKEAPLTTTTTAPVVVPVKLALDGKQLASAIVGPAASSPVEKHTTADATAGASAPQVNPTDDASDGPDAPGAPAVVKADGEKAAQVAIYDKNGKLVGIVDPGDIVRIQDADPADKTSDDTPADGDTDGADGDGLTGDGPVAEPRTPDGADLTPAPPADAGTPADGGDGVTKTTTSPTDQPDTTNTTTNTTTSPEMFTSLVETVAKQILDTYSATHGEKVTVHGDAIVELANQVETLKSQVKTLEEQPAEPKVFTNGAVPPAHMLRGQDHGDPAIDVAKARELKRGLYGAADATEQNRIATDMQSAAIARLQEIHQRRPAQ